MKIFNKQNFSKKNLVRVGKIALATTAVVVVGVFANNKLKERTEYFENEDKRLKQEFEDLIESRARELAEVEA